jgi:hypothetical protein
MTGKKSHLSNENQKRLERLKAGAHERILKREFVSFRVDVPMMQLLLKVADQKRQPLGVMVREWVERQLGEEAQALPLPEIELPNGEILTEKSIQVNIEKAIFAHQTDGFKLSDKQYRTLMDWLLDRHLAEKYKKRAV